ncbi:c-type cytochrome [Phytopseudomonas dryadis]|uniref:Cytochrome c family protein n=1 Tax=Phytopseudomonas dryadis TaxID=2487520 RepID=A0ABY1Z782_9GAMM|nr:MULTISPECIES: c-type cytochrome [Pseudomonas]TBV06989.1 cytochrome c family protein [Pseudomonas dryadis]TBV19618.1 cytochrome c family protein [Pseudomonas sp. FRB 230]
MSVLPTTPSSFSSVFPLPARFRAALLLLAILTPGLVHAEADVAAGEALFKRSCGNCHRVGPGARAAFGPQLNGIFGRTAGATVDYRYSAAMQASGVVWTRETLSAFIKDADEVVPGNKMRFWGIGDQQKIDGLLLYLQAQPAQ